MGIQVHLDDGVRGVGGHFLFDGHAILNVVAMRIDLLPREEPVQAGIAAHAPAVGRQQNMGDAEAGQTLPAFAADVAVNVSDLQRIFKEIGRGVPGDHDVGGNLRHGGQGAQTASVGAVAPCGVVLVHRMHPDAEKKDQHSQNHEKVRQTLAARVIIVLKQERPVAIH